MLILTRTASEAIMVGGDLRVSVSKVRGDLATFTVEPDASLPYHSDLTIGETLKVAANTSLTVLGIRGRQVRIGVDAPKSVTVDREEVHLRKESERRARNRRANRRPIARRFMERFTAAVMG